ncbi:MAG TPA: Ig-like domain-containing protein [Longimicrobium sp.]|nr:Ig-like domain-containing protein [Longimicrobium sp.]
MTALALLAAGALPAGCKGGGRVADPQVVRERIARAERRPQAEVWIGSTTSPEEEPIQLGDQVRVAALKVIRVTREPDREAERRARMIWTSRNPAVATVDSAGRVTALAPGRTTIIAQLDPATLPAWAPPPEADSTYVRVVPVNAALARLRFRSLAISRAEASANNCAVSEDGRPYCWGMDISADEEVYKTLEAVPGGARFASVTRGESHSCGLTADGRALCWGASARGALGTGSILPARRPAPVAPELRFVQLSAGREHTCGVTAASELYCWGSNLAGQTGPRADDRCASRVTIDHGPRRERASCSPRPVRVMPDVPVRTVAAGDAHTCALDAGGTPWCWGDDFDQQVPRAGARPTRVATDQRFTSLWAGSRHTCALTAAGEAYCWGRNWRGQMGMESPRLSRTPLRVPVDARFTSLATGDEHTCGIAMDGRAWCWGYDWGGMLGTGREPQGQQAPAPVARGLRFRQLAAGKSHTCGVTIAGGLFCWGGGLYFDLEGATLNDRPEPVRVAGPQG